MWHMRPYEGEFAFGYEMGRIARALVTGYGFADPFSGHTGPTAWVAPLYPWILALDFRLFGVYTAVAAWMILAFDCVLNALMVCTTWEIAARCFNRKVALWSAWLWALYPATMQYAVKWIWEMTLTAFLFSWILVLALRMRNIGEADHGAPAPGAGKWALFGLLWGLLALTNPSLLLFMPVCGLWILAGVPRRAWWPRQIASVALAAVIFVVCLAPVDLSQLARVSPIRADPRESRRGTVSGQWSWGDGAADGIQPSLPGAGPATACIGRWARLRT